uniref:Uncharacterized protein n=1 Tax=Anthurium amnicola TaxID=1678845 RepID=A0A1D1XFS6_9ARAE
MAMTRHLLSLLLLLLVILHAEAAAATTDLPSPSPAPSPGDGNETVYDLLPLYGLPRGLLPGNVVNHSRSDDGDFTVELSEPCYVQFSELAYYERTITGRISYGLISNLSGVQVRKFFIWVHITRLAVDKNHGTIQFNAGLFSEQHPVSEFDSVHPCMKWVSSSSSPLHGPAAVAAA